MFVANTSLGIDLRTDSLRLAYVQKDKEATRLLAYANTELPSAEAGIAEYETSCINLLRKFIEQNDVKTENILLGIPQKDAVFRRISIPAVAKEDLRQILEFEIERHIPFAIKDVYFNFEILQHLEENKLDIIFVAVKKETVNYVLSLIKAAEIPYSRLILNTFALFSCLDFQKNNSNDQDHNYLTVYVDKNDVEIAVVSNRKLIFSHTFNKKSPDTVTMANLNKDISSEVKGIIKASDKVSIKLAENLRQEIHFLLISLSKISQISDINKIHLGGVGVSPEIVKYIQTTVQTDTVLFDPLDNLAAPDFAEPPAEAAIAIGLALEGVEQYPSSINLLPNNERRVKKDNSFLIPAALGAVLLLIVSAGVASYFMKDRLELTRLEEQLALMQPQMSVIEKKTEEYNKLMGQFNNLNQIGREPITVLDVLKELTTIIPSDVWLDRFKMSKNEFEIGGFASSASILIPILEDSPFFKNVKFTSTITSVKEGKEQFQIKMELAL